MEQPTISDSVSESSEPSKEGAMEQVPATSAANISTSSEPSKEGAMEQEPTTSAANISTSSEPSKEGAPCEKMLISDPKSSKRRRLNPAAALRQNLGGGAYWLDALIKNTTPGKSLRNREIGLFAKKEKSSQETAENKLETSSSDVCIRNCSVSMVSYSYGELMQLARDNGCTCQALENALRNLNDS